MKTLLKSFAGIACTFMLAMTVISCDPCAGVVCNNGDCSNGTCVCLDGYEKKATSCVGVNKSYSTDDGMILATVLTVDSSGSSATTTGVGYTLTTSFTDPYSFSLVSFLSIANNDIDFTISPTNFDVITPVTVNTGAGKTYMVSGSRTGSQVQLVIKAVATQITYTISYSVA